MKPNPLQVAWLAAPLCLVLVASWAHASDGLIEINHEAALAGGVTPGDGPGYPVDVTGPGSYLLTGDLRPPAGSRAITMTGSWITLDLNGFSIHGTTVCTGVPVTSCVAHGGEGIYHGESTARGVVVRNGTIQGMDSGVTVAGIGARLENIAAIGNSAFGMAIGELGLLRHCRSSNNRLDGIIAGPRVQVSECFIHGNGRFGITLEGGSSVRYTTVHANALSGIYMLPPGSADHNVVDANLSAGIFVNVAETGSTARVRIDANMLSNNVLGDLSATASGVFLSTNSNVCTTAAC